MSQEEEEGEGEEEGEEEESILESKMGIFWCP